MMKHIAVLCNSANTPKNNLAGSNIDFSFSIPDSKSYTNSVTILSHQMAIARFIFSESMIKTGCLHHKIWLMLLSENGKQNTQE
jgi:hypothetical protein